MNGTFNGQILVEKLAKLNSSQQSIETLSHWCIFHRTKAKQVVETWDRQFHCSAREQRLAFLYLANDILQNSRRKGAEFVCEFWKVLPDALRDVIENGDELERNAALRLIGIWEERKVFGSRGKILKEELIGRNLDNSNRDGETAGSKLKQSVGSILEKIVSSYEVVYDGTIDEEALLSKCRTAVAFVDKVDKEIGSDYSSGKLDGSEVAELQGQHGILRESIQQLRAAESSRATLMSHLKDALQEQEFKLDQVRIQLKAAQTRSEQVGNICQQLMNCDSGSLQAEQSLKEASTFSDMPSGFTPETPAASGDEEKSAAPVMYTPRGPPFPNNASNIEEETRKSAAAAVAAKLAASTSSAQMLSLVLSSLASEGVIGNQLNGSSVEYPSGKRSKLKDSPFSYIPQSPQHPPPLPPFPHPESLQHKVAVTSQQLMQQQQQPPPPPPSSSPPLPPVPPPPGQLMQAAGSMTSVPYSYGLATPQRAPPPPLPGYPVGGPPLTGMPSYQSPNPYQNFTGSEGSFYSQSPLPASPAISRQ